MRKSSENIGFHAGGTRNFTLIELLIVIAIISILAAMLLPALNSAMETAKKMTCLSSMKQVASAIHMYGNDFQDWLPPAKDWYGKMIEKNYIVMAKGKRWSTDPWGGYIFKGSNVFVCPRMPDSYYWQTGDYARNSDPTCALPGSWGSGGYTDEQKRGGWGDLQYGTKPYNKLSKYPGSALLFTEKPLVKTETRGAVTVNVKDSYRVYYDTVQNAVRTTFLEHQKKTNLAFGDGHVSSRELFPRAGQTRVFNDNFTIK